MHGKELASWGNSEQHLLNSVSLQIDEGLLDSQPLLGVREEKSKFWGPIGFMKALWCDSSDNPLCNVDGVSQSP